MKCQTAQGKISLLIDNELTDSEKAELDSHLSICPNCLNEYESYMTIHEAMTVWRDEEPSLMMSARFMSAINDIENQSTSKKQYFLRYLKRGGLATSAAAAIIAIGMLMSNNITNINETNTPVINTQANSHIQNSKPVVSATMISENNTKPEIIKKTGDNIVNKPIKRIIAKRAPKQAIRRKIDRIKIAVNESEKNTEQILIRNIESAKSMNSMTAMAITENLNEANLKMNESIEMVRGTLSVAADLIASDQQGIDTNGEIM